MVLNRKKDKDEKFTIKKWKMSFINRFIKTKISLKIYKIKIKQNIL